MMEELLFKGYLYTFRLAGTRKFNARFDEIVYPSKTLIVTEYDDGNGRVPGTRTLPFQWIKSIEIITTDPMLYAENGIETNMLVDTKNGIKKRTNSKPPKMVNNFMA
tara:strand:- start:1242 stop:1562 length:321 start_codon:yes stop_codon:yes gene_type:complete